jgi:pyroglutamyl-peptidase
MKRILVTGFEPFGGGVINPSQQVVLALSQMKIPGVSLHTLILKVDQVAGPAAIIAELSVNTYDAVLCLGEAARRPAISVERVAVNLMDFRIPDNSGSVVVDQPVIPGGPAAYFVTLPVRRILDAVQQAGVPAELSLSAGAYLCNQVLYTVLHRIAGSGSKTQAGFIHLPALPEEALHTNPVMASMSLETSLKGVQAAIQVVGERLMGG